MSSYNLPQNCFLLLILKVLATGASIVFQVSSNSTGGKLQFLIVYISYNFEITLLIEIVLLSFLYILLTCDRFASQAIWDNFATLFPPNSVIRTYCTHLLCLLALNKSQELFLLFCGSSFCIPKHLSNETLQSAYIP